MTTARTHNRNVRSGGVARPLAPEPKPDDYTPVSAETFLADMTPVVEGEVPFDPSTLDYDPADHNVEEVEEFVTANPETVDAVLELELNGKGRSTLLSWLDNFESEG